MPKHLRLHEDMRRLVGQDVAARGTQILDARSPGRFTGADPEPRADLSSGHMPGSINVPFNTLLDTDNGVMHPPARLVEVLEAAGVDRALPTVTTCGSGVTACVIALAMQSIDDAGLSPVGGGTAVYDGSWSQWASDSNAPIHKL